MITTPAPCCALPIIRRLLLALMLLALGLPALLTILVGVGPVRLSRALRSRPLIGTVEPPGPPPLRLATWWRGEFQRDFEPWFATIIEPRGWIIRWTNQLYYAAFRKSYMLNRGIVVGRHEYLYGMEFIEAYCRADGTNDVSPAVAPRIARLRELGDRLASERSLLVVLVTPSKAVTLAKFLPPGVCDRPVAPEWPSMHFIALLRQAGIPVIDGPALVRTMMARDPLPPFARGSVHWSLLVGKRVASIVMDELGRSWGVDHGGLTLRDVQWTAAPIGFDADLAALLNLRRPPLDYLTGTAELVCRPTAAGRRTALIAVGGSFTVGVLEPLAACGLFEHVDLYFYYTMSRFQWPGERESVDRARLRWQDRLAGPHVVLVELNEALLSLGAPHLDLFLDDALAALR